MYPTTEAFGKEIAVADVAPAPDGVDGDFAYDLWPDRWGQSLGDVPVGTLPDSTTQMVGSFQTPNNVADQYAVRIRALFTPTQNGDYRFFV